MSNSTATVLQPAQLSVEALNQQIRSTVVRALYHSFNDSQRHVILRGSIGDIPAADYRRCYRVSLRDRGQAVYLDIPRHLLTARNIECGDYIQGPAAFCRSIAGRANPAESIFVSR